MSGPAETRGRLHAVAPDGWSVTESWTLRAPGGQAEVVLTREPLPPDLGTEQYAQGRGDRLAAEYPQYQQHVLTVLPLASGPAYARLFSWTASGGTRVLQVQVCATAPGAGVTATGTAPAASFESVADVLDGVLRSVALDAPAAPGGATAAEPAPAVEPGPAPGGATAVRPEPVEPEPSAGPEPEPEPGPPVLPAGGSTSATVMVQLPPRPPSPPRPQS